MSSSLFSLSAEWLSLLVRFLIVGGALLFIFWMYLVVRCKVSNGRLPIKELTVRARIEASLVGILVYFIYLFVFIYLNGWQRFTWGEWHWSLSRNIYALLIPEELVIAVLVVCFFINISRLSKIYNK